MAMSVQDTPKRRSTHWFESEPVPAERHIPRELLSMNATNSLTSSPAATLLANSSSSSARVGSFFTIAIVDLDDEDVSCSLLLLVVVF